MNRDDDSDIARLFARFGGDPDTYQEIAVAVVTESPTGSAKAAPHAQPGPGEAAPATQAAAAAGEIAAAVAGEVGAEVAHEVPAAVSAEAAVTVIPVPFMDSNPLRRLSVRRETGMGSQCLPDLFKRLLSL